MISVASSFPEITITIKISNIQDYHHQLHSDDAGNDGDDDGDDDAQRGDIHSDIDCRDTRFKAD